MAVTSFDPDTDTCEGAIFGLPFDAEQARVVLVPVPFDATTSYRGGAADGPNAILQASVQVDLHDLETGEPWRQGIAMLDEPAGIRQLNEKARQLLGPDHNPNDEDLGRVNEIGEAVTGWIRNEVGKWMDRGKLCGLVGGDHSLALGSVLAAAARHPSMGILHIDAHADLREAYQGLVHSHASVMYNVLARSSVPKLVQVAVRDVGRAEVARANDSDGRVRAFYDVELARRQMQGESFAAVVRDIVRELPGEVYISFDIDGLDPSLCPNTGTPVPGGLSFHQASFLVGAVAQSGRRIVGFDLCEVAPGAGGEGIDAIVGARVLYKLIGWTLRSQQPAAAMPT